VKLELSAADLDRVIDGLEVLARHYEKGHMTRARERTLEVRAEVVRQANWAESSANEGALK
jgi:hypothetical protein